MILVKKYMNRDSSSPYLFPFLESREGDVYKRQGLPAEERSSGGCHYLPSPQNGSSVVGDVDAGSHVPLAEVYEP